jgi:hypothetical protein
MGNVDNLNHSAQFEVWGQSKNSDPSVCFSFLSRRRRGD